MEDPQRRVAVLSAHLRAERAESSPRPLVMESIHGRERRRCVVVTGVRTPFVRSFGDLLEASNIDLGVATVAGLLKKTKLDPHLIDEVIWGTVVFQTAAPNTAREIVIDLNLPRKIPGVTCSRACLSGLQAIEQGVALIEGGYADIVVAGGGDSLSNGEMSLPRRLTHALAKANYSRRPPVRKITQFFKDAGPLSGWIPKGAAIAERSTGRTMGYHADLMAELNKVPREEQEAYSMDSHRKAAAAQRTGRFQDYIVPVQNPATGKVVAEDNLIRGQQDKSKIVKLRPAFRKTGTVTAATSSPLTDGASAVLLMSETKAKELGFPTDISFKSFANSAIDPYPQLLMAPTIAIPKALDMAGLTLSDIDIVEMHEAFAAQVLSTLNALASPEYCKRILGRDEPVGSIPPEKLNPVGGSVAIGHPFSATGGRMVLQGIDELRRTGRRYLLLSLCAAGGLGGAAVLENVSAQQ